MPLPGRPPSGGMYSVQTYSLRISCRMFSHIHLQRIISSKETLKVKVNKKLVLKSFSYVTFFKVPHPAVVRLVADLLWQKGILCHCNIIK